jgi:hypothetical protein
MWLFCPHCEEPLKQSRYRKANVDREVRRDNSGVKVMLGLMAVLGAIGILWYFGAALSDGQPEMILAGVGGLLLAVLISTGFMFWRTRHTPAQRGVGRVVVGTLAVIGTAMAGGCALTAAVFVFLLVVCLAGGGRF